MFGAHPKRATVSIATAISLLIPLGTQVRLSDVADVQICPAQSVVYRENDLRRIDVAANIEGSDLAAAMKEVNNRFSQKIEFPLGYHYEVIGEFAERQAAQDRLLWFAVAAAFGVFLILWELFRNLRLAILGFLT